jgi:hypothetical protein
MEGLKQWLAQQFDERLVEPNSSLGKAIAYLRGHWDTLTRFLSVPGAPLDNNMVERALKLFIRQRGLDQGTQDTCGKKFPPTPKNQTSLLKSIPKKEKVLQT